MFDGNWSHHGMMGEYDGGWSGFMGFHGILSLLFLGLIIFAGIALFREWRQGRPDSPVYSTLAEKYARGEIDRDEYFVRKKIWPDNNRPSI
jgi:uncharacterized membrane protein